MTSFARDRSEASFRTLYGALTPRLYRTALGWFGGRSQEAEEAVQEAWVRAVRDWERFRGDASFATWLTGIVLNCCREQMRRRSRWVDEGEAPDAWVPSADLPLRLELARALDSLAPGYREVLLLHDLEGFTHAEIAGLLGIEEGTSKSQLSRARLRLRALLSTAAPRNAGPRLSDTRDPS